MVPAWALFGLISVALGARVQPRGSGYEKVAEPGGSPVAIKAQKKRMMQAKEYVSMTGVCSDENGIESSPSTWVQGPHTIGEAVAHCRAASNCGGIVFLSWTFGGPLERVSASATIKYHMERPAAVSGNIKTGFMCISMDQNPVETEADQDDHVSSYGDPHSMNIHGQRFDIKRPGNHSFLVLPRGAEQGHANLYVEARVTRRGGLCTGQLFITGLKLAGRWVRALGGDVELYAETSMFNSPEVVGLRLGNSSNISLEELVARIPKHKLGVSQSRPELPATLNTHVNTLMLQFQVGPSTVKVGWAHEKLNDGFANWLWLGVSGLGTTDEVGGLLGLDDHSAVENVPEDVLSACRAHPQPEGPAAGLVEQPGLFRSWAFAEA